MAMTTSLRLETSAPDRTVRCVALHGELDLDCAYRFDEALRRLEAERPAAIVLDLRGLVFCDTSGLARLLALRRRARRDGWRLLMVRGSAAVQRLLAVTALSEHFEMVSDTDAALALARGAEARLAS
jgi:anti-anti-sigma factor